MEKLKSTWPSTERRWPSYVSGGRSDDVGDHRLRRPGEEDGGPDYVEPAARVAVFDNDGTLWSEKPLVIQLDFTIRRLGRAGRGDPTLRDRQPYQAAYEKRPALDGRRDGQALPGDDSDLQLLMGAVTQAFETVTVRSTTPR